MRIGVRLAAAAATLLIGAAGMAWPGSAHARSMAPTRNIYSFTIGSFRDIRPDPSSDLAVDAAGNLYGTTSRGGPSTGCQGIGCGTIFRLVRPTVKGQPWTEQTLYEFGNGGSGAEPLGRPLLDTAGNVYGTTYTGSGLNGPGTVWKLSAPAVVGSQWRLTVLLSGVTAAAGVVMDRSGVMYGATLAGGADNEGSAFSLTPPPAGGTSWTETILYSFASSDPDFGPVGPLALSSDQSTLFGIAGNAGYGQFVYRLRRQGSAWRYSLIHQFAKRADGILLFGGLLVDRSNNIFGTTRQGGGFGHGSVFELSPPALGETKWTEQVLHGFDGLDGEFPVAGVIAGETPPALFGTASEGGQGGAADGSTGSSGVVFRLDPPASGSGVWTYTALHAFHARRHHVGGAGDIQNGLTFGVNGQLFGVASYGGMYGFGAVFSQSPH